MTALARFLACLVAATLRERGRPRLGRGPAGARGRPAHRAGHRRLGCRAARASPSPCARPRQERRPRLVTDGVGQYTSPSAAAGALRRHLRAVGLRVAHPPGVELRPGELFILDQQLGLASLAETVAGRRRGARASAARHRRRLRPRRPRPRRCGWWRRKKPEADARAGGAAGLGLRARPAGRRQPDDWPPGRPPRRARPPALRPRRRPGARRRRRPGPRDRPEPGRAAPLPRRRSRHPVGQVGPVRRADGRPHPGRRSRRSDTSVAIVVYACGELFAGDTVEPFDALPVWTAQGLRTPQYDDPPRSSSASTARRSARRASSW